MTNCTHQIDCLNTDRKIELHNLRTRVNKKKKKKKKTATGLIFSYRKMSTALNLGFECP
jgi:hypothetical protein